MVQAMPRKPTMRARQATAYLRKLVAETQINSKQPLPTSRALGREFGLCHSTIFRILSELAQEGLVWQQTNGRFFAASSRSQAFRGLPVVLIGRQIKQWSHLYREILEGISEVCAALGSPLILLSSSRLVEHENPELPPRFASAKVQSREIEHFRTMIPKRCAAVIFDHMWDDRALAALNRPEVASLLLLRSSGLSGIETVLPDYTAGARLVLRHVIECGYEEVQLAIPFASDPSVEECARLFSDSFAIAGGKLKWRKPWGCETPKKRSQLIGRLSKMRSRIALVVLEDNIAMLLREELERRAVDVPSKVGIISLQGTAGPASPLTRVRYDYRRIGRSAVAVVLGKGSPQTFPPALITAGTTNIQPLRLGTK